MPDSSVVLHSRMQVKTLWLRLESAFIIVSPILRFSWPRSSSSDTSRTVRRSQAFARPHVRKKGEASLTQGAENTAAGGTRYWDAIVLTGSSTVTIAWLCRQMKLSPPRWMGTHAGLTGRDGVLRQVLHVDAELDVLPDLEMRRLRVEQVREDLVVDLQEAAPEHALPRGAGLRAAGFTP